MAEQKNRLIKVVNALEKINPEIQQMILDMARQMTTMEIIQLFNQQALDLFNTMIEITREIGQEKKSNLVDTKVFLNMPSISM